MDMGSTQRMVGRVCCGLVLMGFFIRAAAGSAPIEGSCQGLRFRGLAAAGQGEARASNLRGLALIATVHHDGQSRSILGRIWNAMRSPVSAPYMAKHDVDALPPGPPGAINMHHPHHEPHVHVTVTHEQGQDHDVPYSGGVPPLRAESP